MTSTIYVIATVLLVVCFLIIEKALSRESKARIIKLEKEINLRDQMIIDCDNMRISLNKHISEIVEERNSLRSRLHRNRNANGTFVKSEK